MWKSIIEIFDDGGGNDDHRYGSKVRKDPASGRSEKQVDQKRAEQHLREIQLQCHTAKVFNDARTMIWSKQIQQQNRAQHDRDSHQVEGAAEWDI